MLILASQKFEGDEAQQYLGNDESDEILLLVSQKFEENYLSDVQLLQCENLVASPRNQERFRGDPFEELFRNANDPFEEFFGSANLRYGSLKTSKQVNEVKRLDIPRKTQDQNKWVANVWCDWVQYWLYIPCVKKKEQHQPLEDFCKMSIKYMKFWLAKRTKQSQSQYTSQSFVCMFPCFFGFLHEGIEGYWKISGEKVQVIS